MSQRRLPHRLRLDSALPVRRAGRRSSTNGPTMARVAIDGCASASSPDACSAGGPPATTRSCRGSRRKRSVGGTTLPLASARSTARVTRSPPRRGASVSMAPARPAASYSRRPPPSANTATAAGRTPAAKRAPGRPEETPGPPWCLFRASSVLIARSARCEPLQTRALGPSDTARPGSPEREVASSNLAGRA